jgi:hypothetical protein
VHAKAQADLVTRNAKAYAAKVKAEAVRMQVLGGVKRKRDAEDACDKLREASKATNAMLKAAGELLLEEGTEDACHAITDRFGRCVLLPAIYKLRGILWLVVIDATWATISDIGRIIIDIKR